MMSRGIPLCVIFIVTWLTVTKRVDARTTTLIATPTEATSEHYMYYFVDSTSSNNTIIIEAESGKLVYVDVKTQVPLTTTGCQNGAIKLYTGGAPSSGYYMGSVCGQRWNWFTAAHNVVVIILDYNLTIDAGKLSLKYRTQKGCGGTITAGQYPSYIRSPGYPNRIPSNSRYSPCLWVAGAPDGQRVRFSIKFYHPGTSDCKRSNVSFIDGVNLQRYYSYIHTWCGENPDVFITWENHGAVVAKGLEDMRTGFEIKVQAVDAPRCEHEIDGDVNTEGVIMTPNFPNTYPELEECRWVIKSVRKLTMKITVLESDLAGGDDCQTDSVEIYTNAQARDGVVGKWCGANRPQFEFYTTTLLLIFKSNGKKTTSHNGFRAKYEVSDVAGCGQHLTSRHTDQYFTSPNYPDPFPGLQRCEWVITAENRLMVVELEVITSNLYYSCDVERVEVYDGPNITSTKYLGRWCGTLRPKFRSRSSSLTVVFISNRRNTAKRGFKVKFRTGMCGYAAQIGSYHSIITSPDYPANYKSGYNCFWNVSSSWGAMGFRFVDLDIRCPDDYIMVYDGGYNAINSDKKWKVCGRTQQSFFTNSLHVFIQLKTQTNLGKGFNLTYKGYYKEFKGCSNNILGLYPIKTTRIWHSPGYPDHYFDQMKCRYRFSALKKIELIVHVRGIIHYRSVCNGDYIRVYDGYDQNAEVLFNKICKLGNTSMTSSGKYLYVEFHSDATDTGPGYIFYYRTMGDKIFTESTSYTSSNPHTTTIIITLSVLIPAVAVFICTIVIVCYVRCKGQGGESRTARQRRWTTELEASRDYTNRYWSPETTDIRSTPTAPTASHECSSGMSNPSAPPPSYEDICQANPGKRENMDPSPPPPSYSEVTGTNIITTI